MFINSGNDERVDVTVYDQDAWQPPPEDIQNSLNVGNYLCVSNRPWYYFEFIVFPLARATAWWHWVAINCDDADANE